MVFRNKDNSDSWMQAALSYGENEYWTGRRVSVLGHGCWQQSKATVLMLLKTFFKPSSYFLWIISLLLTWCPCCLKGLIKVERHLFTLESLRDLISYGCQRYCLITLYHSSIEHITLHSETSAAFTFDHSAWVRK